MRWNPSPTQLGLFDMLHSLVARRLDVMVGLPDSAPSALAGAASQVSAQTLISAGSMHRTSRGGFTPIGEAAWQTRAHLDSAGFTAMKQGGYRWSVSDYVEFVVTNGSRWTRDDGVSAMPLPWGWWSAMDYCCEPEIAKNRAEVNRRIDMTIESYGDTLEHLQNWYDEGVNDVPEPLPVLQGRTAADYLRCATGFARVRRELDGCTCPGSNVHNEDEDTCTWQGAHHMDTDANGIVLRGSPLPTLLGVGSVCRRNLHGPEGLLTILDALHDKLPKDVKLHLFGVKGQLLRHLAKYGDRIQSVDSMAWDMAARRASKDRNAGLKCGDDGWQPNTREHRAGYLRRWYKKQIATLPASMSRC